jgi:hypothetical protein
MAWTEAKPDGAILHRVNAIALVARPWAPAPPGGNSSPSSLRGVLRLWPPATSAAELPPSRFMAGSAPSSTSTWASSDSVSPASSGARPSTATARILDGVRAIAARGRRPLVKSWSNSSACVEKPSGSSSRRDSAGRPPCTSRGPDRRTSSRPTVSSPRGARVGRPAFSSSTGRRSRHGGPNGACRIGLPPMRYSPSGTSSGFR